MLGWQAGRVVALEPQPEQPTAAAPAQQQSAQQQSAQQQSAQQRQRAGGPVRLWATQTASLGMIVLDGAGRILYRSDADGSNPPVSNCTGDCARRWHPVPAQEGKQPELLGIAAGVAGTVRREDGTLQVTLAGWPLYTASDDEGDHQGGTGYNGAQGTWFAVTPTGERAAP